MGVATKKNKKKYEKIMYAKKDETPIEKFERLLNNFFVESRERQKYLKLRFVSNGCKYKNQ